ncbi:hypothetical protein NDN08_002757 [Rhodosorus marinus]|uniref:Distal membrane-arm assembly complex protein 1-like domain-containing protein n=1 Tax=Rhodosorus marinus TaxID=101924 RepID=A0AAV8UW31_9RHOD|nr:hypothetical protein NDN08_002757 [Rhodosorus marinus]
MESDKVRSSNNNNEHGLDCFSCRAISTGTCVAAGAFLWYSARSAGQTRGGRLTVRTLGSGLIALGSFNWYVRGDSETLKRVNRALDRFEAIFKWTD